MKQCNGILVSILLCIHCNHYIACSHCTVCHLVKQLARLIHLATLAIHTHQCSVQYYTFLQCGVMADEVMDLLAKLQIITISTCTQHTGKGALICLQICVLLHLVKQCNGFLASILLCIHCNH